MVEADEREPGKVRAAVEDYITRFCTTDQENLHDHCERHGITEATLRTRLKLWRRPR